MGVLLSNTPGTGDEQDGCVCGTGFVALARKLTRGCFAVLKNDKKFDPECTKTHLHGATEAIRGLGFVSFGFSPLHSARSVLTERLREALIYQSFPRAAGRTE